METIWLHKCMITSAGIAPSVRVLAGSFGPAASGMWVTPLSPTGGLPATHYVSAGMIDKPFADMLDSPESLQAGCLALGASVTIEECQIMLGQSDISTEAPFTAMKRLGLKLINTPL